MPHPQPPPQKQGEKIPHSEPTQTKGTHLGEKGGAESGQLGPERETPGPGQLPSAGVCQPSFKAFWPHLEILPKGNWGFEARDPEAGTP